jgi:hypothetical protein
LNCKAKADAEKPKKNGLYRRLFLKYGPPPRGYQIDTASFLYPQGMQKVPRELSVAQSLINGGLYLIYIAWNFYITLDSIKKMTWSLMCKLIEHSCMLMLECSWYSGKLKKFLT